MRHRIVQYQGKRYSLKLDEVVWQSLEEAASASGVRLNQLIAAVAQETDDSTVTGALRLFCLRQSVERVKTLESELKRLSLASRGVPITLIAEALPVPCLVVSQAQVILHANAAAQKWVGVDGEALLGKSVEHHFQIKSALPLAEVVARFGQGTMKIFPAKIVYLRPGRLIMARANLCPAMVNGPDDVAYFILVDGSDAG